MKLAVAMAALGLAHAKQFTVEEQGKKLKVLARSSCCRQDCVMCRLFLHTLFTLSQTHARGRHPALGAPALYARLLFLTSSSACWLLHRQTIVSGATGRTEEKSLATHPPWRPMCRPARRRP